MILVVCECLRGSDHDALTGMYPERIEVLHVTYGYAVVKAVTYHLIFNLLPSFQGFFHKYLV